MKNCITLLTQDELCEIITLAINNSILKCGESKTSEVNENRNNEVFFTINEACAILRITRPTLNKLKKIYGFKWPKLGNLVRIPEDDIKKILSQNN